MQTGTGELVLVHKLEVTGMISNDIKLGPYYGKNITDEIKGHKNGSKCGAHALQAGDCN